MKCLHANVFYFVQEQFALEYIVQDFFMQFCGRTRNPAEADFFYLPLVRDVEYRVALSEKPQLGRNSRDPSKTEAALLLALEKNDTSLWKEHFGLTDKYWHRSGGADHIIVMPAPVTNLRHEAGARGFFHYMMHLHRPIFLNVEYSASFVREYPICSRQKNLVMPYPNTDPGLWRRPVLPVMHGHGHGHGHGSQTEVSGRRSRLLFYQGGMHGSCTQVRKGLSAIMQGAAKEEKLISAIAPERRENAFESATFCAIPIGDSPSSKRMNRGGDASGSGVLRIVAEVLRCCIRLIAQNIDITVWNE